jgi:hypothetical protein
VGRELSENHVAYGVGFAEQKQFVQGELKLVVLQPVRGLRSLLGFSPLHFLQIPRFKK